jgi:hypothetical protein
MNGGLAGPSSPVKGTLVPSRKRSPPATRRRALELLASCRDGCTEAIMEATLTGERS